MKDLSSLIDDEDVLEINNSYPSIIVRKGMGLLFIFFLLLLSLMAFIPYPEKIEIDTVLDSVSKRFVYQSDASDFKIEKILGKNNQKILKGDKMAIAINYNSGRKIDIIAPFEGNLIYAGPVRDNLKLYLLDINENIQRVTGLINSDKIKAVRKRQSASIGVVGTNNLFMGFVESIEPVPLKRQYLVTVKLNPSDQLVLKKILHNDILQPLNIHMAITINESSVLRKTFGILADQLAIK
jgi:hypothetical protein